MISIVVAFLVGVFLSWCICSMQRAPIDQKLKRSEQDLDRLAGEKQGLLERVLQLEKALSRLEVEKEALTGVREDLKKDFELLSNQILEKKTAKIQEQSEKNLKAILSPFKEKIQEFQKQVETAYHQESRERFALKKELQAMVMSNQKISEEASNLTRAFKGDVKAQGCWGEIVLEKILDSSGLRKGEEYHVQGKDLKLTDDQGRRLQPDIIISLPEEKHLIIDAKVSLIPYERYLGEELDEKKGKHIKDLMKSLHTHIDDLHGKSYVHIEGINPPDFVLLFIPIEGLFSFALQKSPELFSYGWDRSIMLVSPSTLLATLRTVSSIWKHERQNKNTVEIVRQSGLLYDKFANLVTELQKLGDALGRAGSQYDDVMRKLKTGKGSLLNRVESLKLLGAKATKTLPTQDLIEIE